MRKALLAGQKYITLAAEAKRAKRKTSGVLSKTLQEEKFKCQNCGRICKSAIGLISHSKLNTAFNLQCADPWTLSDGCLPLLRLFSEKKLQLIED